MVYENLEISIERDYQRLSVKIWVFERTYDANIFYSIQDGLVISQKVENHIACFEGELKPFMEVHEQFMHVLFSAITEHQSSKGYRSKDHNLIEGKLSATQDHLNDMKQIAFKLLKIESK